MNSEVIKSFLIGLGFSVDESSLAKFNKSIASASLKVTALYATIKASAAGIFYSIAKISEGFEEVGYNLRLVAPAVNKMLLLRAAMLDAYRRAGIDLTKVVKQSILFNFSLAKTKFALEAVYKSVGARFLPLLTKQLDIFRAKIFANMPKIQARLESFVKFIFKAFEATTILGERVFRILGSLWEALKRLDTATDGWSTKILAFVAAWELLNLEFLATPLGAILAGLLAIVALYDDFKVWEEGGKSFFNWAPFIPVIRSVESALSSLWATLNSIADVIGNLVLAFYQLFHSDTQGFWESLLNSGRAVLTVFKDLWGSIKGIAGILGSLGTFGAGLLGSPGAQTVLNGPTQSQPLLPSQSGVNQKVSQETNINIQGSADANATGKAVASEQSKVNFDLTRNLKGATR